jgi:prepilin-type N-terminal cleavage/methylation domain-containing protein
VRNIKSRNELGIEMGTRSAGFSLIEVMICLVVLTVAVTIFVTAIAQNVRLEAMNAETNVALRAAKGVVENVHTLTYAQVTTAEIPATFTAEGATNDGRTMKLIDASGSTQVGSVTITENGPRTKKTVEATVTWRCATGGIREVMLMTEVTNY